MAAEGRNRGFTADSSSVFGEGALAETAIALALDQDIGLRASPCSPVKPCPAGRQSGHSIVALPGQCWDIDSGSPFEPLN